MTSNVAMCEGVSRAQNWKYIMSPVHEYKREGVKGRSQCTNLSL